MSKITKEMIVDKLKNLTKREILLAVVVIAILAGIIQSFFGEAEASGYTPPAVTTTNVTNITGVEGNEFHSYMAANMAADAIHCTTSSRKHKMGVGMGNSEGHNGFAVGYCNSIEFKGKPVMLGVKATTATDTKPTYSIGVNWTFD